MITWICSIDFETKLKIDTSKILNGFVPYYIAIHLKHYENGKRKNVHDMSQGWPNPGFMQKKVQKGDFLKKDSRELNFFFLVLGSYEYPEGLER